MQAPPRCYFLRLPTELLIAIVEWTAHPGDILSLAYTCRHLYQLFAHRDSESVWKYARDHRMIIERLDIADPRNDSAKASSVAKYVNARWTTLPIPPPLPGQTEICLAQLLFGQKTCPCCKKKHKNIPEWGVSLGITLCKDCWFTSRLRESIFISTQDAKDMFQDYEYQSSIEDFEILVGSLRVTLLPFPSHPRGRRSHLNREAWRIILGQYIEIRRNQSTPELDNFLKICSAKAKHSKQTTTVVSDNLDAWASRYRAHLRFLTNGFIESAQAFARSYEITPRALRMVPKFQQLRKQSITRPMFDSFVATSPYLDQIISESRNIQRKLKARDLREAEENQLSALRHYFDHYPFPKGFTLTFETFISLSIIKSLRNSHNADVVAHEHHDSLLSSSSNMATILVDFDTLLNDQQYKKLLDNEVDTWKKQVTAGARRLLGYSEDHKPHWNMTNTVAKKKKREKRRKRDIGTEEAISTAPDSRQFTQNPATSQPDSEAIGQTKLWYKTPGKLDPELRVTSWFVCNACQSLERRYRRPGVLDFLGMCAHQCQRPDCSKRNPLPWAITNFAPALHAIETTRAMLKILSLDEEASSTTIKCFDGLWLCKNCAETMKAMEWEDLVRHCSRHSMQRLEKISTGDAMTREQARAEGRRPFTVRQLLSNKEEGKKKRLLCIHCVPSSKALLYANLRVLGLIDPNGAPKVMDIHGIIQHLKVKHKVTNIRNEDIYFMDGSLDGSSDASETGNSQTTSSASNSTVDLIYDSN